MNGIGDKVQWTHKRYRGSSIELIAMEGKILSIDGDIATVKRIGSGRKYQVRVNALRPIDQENELTETILAIRRDV